ncbi:SNF2-related protein [Caldinitratiruptor microaerophilus]|nr:SNF2-related protein [Caldinitratiruptor microaerophilus]
MAWNVAGLALEPARAVTWLAALPDRPGQPYYRFGADLRCWTLAARLALELLARGRFVPAVHPDAPAAVWQPVLSAGADQERVQALAGALPPVCRALAPAGADPATYPAPDALALVTGFLQAGADALIRRWLGETPAAERAGRAPRPVPGVAGRWLEALAAPTAAIPGTPAEVDTLRTRLSAWSAPVVQGQAPAAFRTCFRLEPPDGDDAGDGASWALHVLLQAADDPSLLVPAAEVWRARGSTLRYLNRRLDHPQERLLADLGVAARLFPPLERALDEARPESCPLTPTEAYLFLKEGALLLQESGLGVLLPASLAGGARLGARLRVRSSSASPRAGAGGGLGLSDLLDVDWEIVLGDQPLSREELHRLARLKVPLVRMRGQWVEVNPERLADALRRLERQGRTLTVGDALRLAAGAGEAAPGLPVVGVDAEGAAADLLRRLSGDGTLEELPTPAGLRGQLRPYQVRGFSWLAFLRERGIGACLADDMGLGKTVQVIALWLHERAAGLAAGPTLLVCPTSVVGNWQRELARFAPSLRVLVHHGADRLRGEDFRAEAEAHDVVITTYALAQRDAADLAAMTWNGIVLDEAQNIKNPATRQSQSLRALRAGYRIALTGTPVENRLGDLWSIMEFLNPGYLGSAQAFHRQFAVPIERYRDAEAAARLQRLVRPFILRRVKTDPAIIQDLPEKQELPVYVNLTPEQATLYAAVAEEMLERIAAADGIERRGLVLSALTKLKQVCNHPAHLLGDGSALPGRSGKLDRLAEMLEEVLEEGDAALVFTQFTEMGTLLQRFLRETFGQEVLFLHGGVPRAARSRMVERFQAADGPQIMVLSLKAGGVGLNLTRASHVFHFDRWWNPAVENQATDRAYRIGQHRRVMVHKLISAGTVEEKIDALIASKRELAERVVGTGEAWLTELSDDELRGLLSLDRE